MNCNVWIGIYVCSNWMLCGQHILSTKLILRYSFIQSQLSKQSKKNTIVSIPLFPYKSVPLPIYHMTVPQCLLIHHHLIIRVYLVNSSRCSDLSLGLTPSCSCHGWDILWMVIFGFRLFAARGDWHHWLLTEFPCMVVHATASTLTFFKLCFYQRRGNCIQLLGVCFAD